MKLDDESILTAYLDNELDESTRDAVALELESNQELAVLLAELAAVRRFVRGMSRPTVGRDVTPEVMASIQARGSRSWHSRAGRRAITRRIVAYSATAALAASILFTVVTNSTFSKRGVVPPADRSDSRQRTTKGNSPKFEGDSSSLAKAVEIAAEVATGDRIPTSLDSDARLNRISSAELEEDRERKKILELLDRRDVRRILVTVDSLGDGVLEKMELAIRETGLMSPDYGRITISQGIVIDPEHPDQATVFALVMNENEILRFRNRLIDHLPTFIAEDWPATPDLVAQLTDLSQFALLRTEAAAGLTAAPSHLDQPIAIREESGSPLIDSHRSTSSQTSGQREELTGRARATSSDAKLEKLLSNNELGKTSSDVRNALLSADSGALPPLRSEPDQPISSLYFKYQGSRLDPTPRALPSKHAGSERQIVLVWVTARQDSSSAIH